MTKRTTVALALALALAGALSHASAYASGTIAAGKGVNPRDAYTKGKALTFEKLVCSSCPLQKADLDRDRAMSLKNSLEARDEAEKPGTPDDEHIDALDRDEQEFVHFYLMRRYKL